MHAITAAGITAAATMPAIIAAGITADIAPAAAAAITARTGHRCAVTSTMATAGHRCMATTACGLAIMACGPDITASTGTAAIAVTAPIADIRTSVMACTASTAASAI